MRRFMLMSPAGVLETFGRPASVSAVGERVQWVYPSGEHNLFVYFLRGYVSSLSR